MNKRDLADFATGFGNLWNKALDLIFPRRCPICDDVIESTGGDVCKNCLEKPEFLKEPLCRKCGKKLANQESEYCSDCKVRKHFYKEGAALFSYASIKQSLYRFKYAGRQEYAEYYAKQIEKHLGEKIRSWKPEAFVPVPIHSSREKERGYNQAQALAKALGKHMGIKVLDKFVIRSKKTRPQKCLNDGERQNNLKKAFKIRQNDVKLNTIVIIDDIYTTGSTIDELSKECLAAGVHNIYFVTLAIGDGL